MAKKKKGTLLAAKADAMAKGPLGGSLADASQAMQGMYGPMGGPPGPGPGGWRLE